MLFKMLKSKEFLVFIHHVIINRGIVTSTGRQFPKMNFAKLKRKKWGSDYCLENFDEYYKPIFENVYPSIRLALLSQQKYCAFLNNYAIDEVGEDVMDKIGVCNIRKVYNKRLKRLLLRNKKLGISSSILPEEEEPDDLLLEDNIEDEQTLMANEFYDNEGRFASETMHKMGNFNEFVPVTQLKGMTDYVDEGDYQQQNDSNSLTNFAKFKEKPTRLPGNWNIYCFNRGDISTFPSPRSAGENFLGYYLMDAASILPVLALNPRSGDVIYDMCAAPGGKTLAILQTMCDLQLVCNDVSLSRMKRMQNVLGAFIPRDDQGNYRTSLIVGDGRKIVAQTGIYNKILVDAPCTTDRLSATIQESNLFHPNRMAERIRLPQLQTELLIAALRAVKSGGSVVYSTCALSPVQNDGVVHMALKKLWEESSENFVIHDLSDLFDPLGFLFTFHSSPKYGQLVIPNVVSNFGPCYVCKISKS